MIVGLLIFLIGVSQSKSSCPFRNKRFAAPENPGELWQPAHFLVRFNHSLYTAADHDEIKLRNQPLKKNNFGLCPTEDCGGQRLEYRTFSGCGNNIRSNSNYGRRATSLRRLLEPNYDDGVGRPKSVSVVDKWTSLPNPRKISTVVHSGPGGRTNKTSENKESKHHTLALMQWGQFLAHDISLTPMLRDRDGNLNDCKACDSDRRTCSPIPIPKDDTFFPSEDTKTKAPRCLKFVRSQSISTGLWREQLNLVSSWMDSSHIYGSFKCQADNLRTADETKKGQLKSLSHPLGSSFKSLLPRHATNHECRSPSKLCFNAGDDRVNEQPGLTMMHTLLVREHNRIASQFQIINPNWDKETIFQETRKIIVAINQHITFKEYLPRILGQRLMKMYKLSDDFQYDNSCDPGIFNEFATAAFRFGHSLIPEGFKIKSHGLTKLLLNLNDTQIIENYSTVHLRGHFNIPDVSMSPLFMDELSEGIFGDPMAKYDNILTEEIRNHLNETLGVSHSGVDLAALNIQRGRDHGLPGYSEYKHFCSKDLRKKSVYLRSHFNSRPVDNFEDLSDTFDLDIIAKLKEVYAEVKDVDLFTGGISERSVQGGLVGPTFGCIIANQFEKLRKCDRFWYETRQEKLGFTTEQLNQIKKVTLSSLLCNNLDNEETKFQSKIFDLPNETRNPMISCKEHPKIDLKFWSEQNGKTNYCDVNGQLFKIGQKGKIGACTLCECPKTGNPTCKTSLEKSCKDLIDNFGPETVLLEKNCQDYCGHMFNMTLSRKFDKDYSFSNEIKNEI